MVNIILHGSGLLNNFNLITIFQREKAREPLKLQFKLPWPIP